jgi:hypothetical protein
MSVSNLLRLLAGVADVLGDDPTEVRVITVVGTDLSLHLEILRSFATASRASFVDISTPGFEEPVAREAPPALTAAIQQFLWVDRGGEKQEIRVVEEGQGYEVELSDGTRSATASRADQQFLGLARAFMTKEVLESSTVFLVYDETAGMDRSMMQSCWDFVVAGLSGPAIGRVRTVVVFVTVAWIDVRRHCRRSSSGFTFGLVEGQHVLRRDSEQTFVMKVQRLRQSDRPLVFFLGAGFSASSGLPLGNTLRDSAIRTLVNLPAEHNIGPPEIAEFRRFCFDNSLLTSTEQDLPPDEFLRTLTLEQVVRVERAWLRRTPTLDSFARMNDEAIANPGPAVHSLSRVLNSGRRIILVTVNFDTLVETHVSAALNIFQPPDQFDGCGDYIRSYIDGGESAIPYLKLHGSISEPDTCVLTDDVTRGGLPDAVVHGLDSVLGLASDVVYVGASMRDRDLAPYFSRSDFANRVEELWVFPYEDPNVRRFVSEFREDLPGWRHVSQRFVTETADVFLAELATQLA